MAPATLGHESSVRTHADLPAEDIDRARRFYRDILGFEIEQSPRPDQFYVVASDGTRFLVFKRARTRAESTAEIMIVHDLRAVMESMRQNGVRFQEYDFPGFKTTQGVAERPGELAAWFLDSEGNVISIAQLR